MKIHFGSGGDSIAIGDFQIIPMIKFRFPKNQTYNWQETWEVTMSGDPTLVIMKILVRYQYIRVSWK